MNPLASTLEQEKKTKAIQQQIRCRVTKPDFKLVAEPVMVRW